MLKLFPLESGFQNRLKVKVMEPIIQLKWIAVEVFNNDTLAKWNPIYAVASLWREWNDSNFNGNDVSISCVL